MAEAKTRFRKTQQRALDTRAAILAAGAELFATRGYRATGVRDIAALAGCNQALVAYHFGGKGGLYDEILSRAVADAQQLAREANLTSSSSPERELVRVMARALGSNRHLAPMILREQMDPDRLLNPTTANTLRSFMAMTEAVLALTPMDAEARSWDPQVVHLSIVSPLIHFIVATRFREATAAKVERPMTTPSLEDFAETLAGIVSRALRGTNGEIN
jgi:AcrR family transcriptional regulator